MGFRLACRYRSGDLTRARIDDCDGLVEFRGDVKQASVRVNYGQVRTNLMAEVKAAGYRTGGQVQQQQLVTGYAGFADA